MDQKNNMNWEDNSINETVQDYLNDLSTKIILTLLSLFNFMLLSTEKCI